MISVLIVTVLCLIVVSVIRTKRISSAREAWPFKPRRVLTNPEQVLFFRIVKACPDLVVLAQVQLSRLLVVDSPNRMRWLNRVDRKSLDFVLCRRDFSVVCAVELDDSSHARSSRQKADLDKQAALDAAQIPLIRFQVSTMPDESMISKAVIAAGSQGGSPVPGVARGGT